MLIRVLVFVLLIGFCVSVTAQIKVTQAQSATTLAQKLVGKGVTVSNCTLNCPGQANGLFRVVSSNLGLDSGIVLTNGRAATQGSFYGVDGPSSYFASANNYRPGDPELTLLAGRKTYDACSLEFDIIPNGDSIKFSYVFTSEEYISAVCGSYNDVFAFFISGPGISGKDNMALVPETNIPVTINTINNGIPGSEGSLTKCTMMGPGSPFTAYYTDNSVGSTLTHEGMTKVLQAQHKVLPCELYHLKMVIADAGNEVYDSGVFLKAGSLETNNYSVQAVTRSGRDSSLAFCVKGCLPGRFVVKRSQANSRPQTIKYILGGDAISGVDYSPIADSVVIPANAASAVVEVNGLLTSVSGAKALKLYVLSSAICTGVNNIADSATIVIYDSLKVSLSNMPDTAICAKDSVQMRLIGEDIFSYNWSPAAGLSNANAKEPIAFPIEDTRYVVTASLPGSVCEVKKSEIFIRVKPTPDILIASDTTVCYHSRVLLAVNVSSENAFYSYHWTGPNNFVSTLLRPLLDSVEEKDAGIYTVGVANDTNGCNSRASMQLHVNTPMTPKVYSPVTICRGRESRPLEADGDSLLWYVPWVDTSMRFAPVPAAYREGDFRYYVTQKDGVCESPRVGIDVLVRECCKGVVSIPSAFTPNNDGRNDNFRVLIGDGYVVNVFRIYNRWGQLIYSGLDGVWDGTCNGLNADAGTYYYNIGLHCTIGGVDELRNGNVILVR